MKAAITESHHTITIDFIQIDLFYFFDLRLMHVYIDGVLYVNVTFNPARCILSYSNILDVSSYYYVKWKKECDKIIKENELN